MEALVLAGLVGVGYLFNEKNSKKDPSNTEIKANVSSPNGENLYSSNFYNEADNVVRTLANQNFEASYEEGSNVINNQKINRIGSDINQESLSTSISELSENMNEYTYSNAAGGYISVDNFKSDDRGVVMEPFFSSAPANVNIDDPRRLNQTQGGAEFYQSKEETPNFFPLERQEVFGNTFGEGMGDPDRYNNTLLRTNELPFEQERIQHIDSKSGLNTQIGQMIADNQNIDKLRNLSNPKLTYKGKVLSGKDINGKRGLQGEVFKYDPDTFYENNPERYFTTTGAYLEKTGRPEEIIKGTNRSVLNKQPVGNASPEIYEAPEERPTVRKPLKKQLGTDTIRNASSLSPLVSTDIHHDSYRALPNERDTTTLKNHQMNVTTNIDSFTLGLQDDLKTTKKQTTINSKNNGNIQNRAFELTMGIQDDLKKTKKQTTINSKNNGNIKGLYEKQTSGYEMPETSTKDTLLFDHYGNAHGYLREEMSDESYINAETNPTREIISQGRAPVPENVKLMNGEDSVNIQIKKIESDYLTQHLTGIQRVYEDIPSKESKELTTMKLRLNDESIAARIDPQLLNPFRNNPYSQSLESFAYS